MWFKSKCSQYIIGTSGISLTSSQDLVCIIGTCISSNRTVLTYASSCPLITDTYQGQCIPELTAHSCHHKSEVVKLDYVWKILMYYDLQKTDKP